MDADDNNVAETPDLDFDSGPTDAGQDVVGSEEQQVERILDEIVEETPDLEFSEEPVQSTDEAARQSDDDEDIDDLDEPDQYVDDDDETTANDTEGETNGTNGKSKANTAAADNRLVHLPLARVKQIMKVDPDVSLITGECTFLVAKAAELFIESLARESFVHTAQAKKKTIQKRDVDLAIENVESLMFLEGMMNF